MTNSPLKYFLFKSGRVKGFTFVETLVVVVIIGILSAIALRSGLQFITRSREVVGRQQIAQILGTQEGYYYFESQFGATFSDLDLGSFADDPETDSYIFTMATDASAQSSVVTATPTREDVSGYAGRVYTAINPTTNNLNIYQVICEGSPGEVPDVSTVLTEADCPQN